MALGAVGHPGVVELAVAFPDGTSENMGISWQKIWGFPYMGVPPFLDGVSKGKSHRSKWMMTGGTPISGNLHMDVFYDVLTAFDSLL